MSDKHPNSKKITIMRAGSFLNDVQTNAQEFMAMSKQSIGSYFESKSSIAIGSGLSFKEQEMLLPNIVDTPADHRDFRDKVRHFYKAMFTRIPHGTGLTLEVGLEEDNTKPVSKENFPINLMDYLRYRHALGHPAVAKSREEASGNGLINFYIFDPTEVDAARARMVGTQDKAMGIYMKYKDNNSKVIQLLTVLNVDVRTFKGKHADSLRREELRRWVDTKPTLVIDAVENKHFEEKYLLEMMIRSNILKRVSSQFVDVESGDIIGSNEEEAVYYLRNPENSKVVALLRSRLQEATRDLGLIEKKEDEKEKVAVND